MHHICLTFFTLLISLGSIIITYVRIYYKNIFLLFLFLLQSVPNLYTAASPILDIQTDLNNLNLDCDSNRPALSPSDLTSYDLITENDMQQLSLEIEKER